MKNKKLAILATLCLVTATTSVMSGCKLFDRFFGRDNGTTYEVSLDVEALEMTIGETKTVVSTYTQVEGTTLSYTSSDPSVATVDGTGKITAVSKGTATITATYGEATDACTVTVGLGGNVPMLELPNVTDAEVTLNMWMSLDLNGTVHFNGVTYEDVTFAYTLSDSTVGAIADGVFTPTGIGTTELTITATWRGITATDVPTFTKSVTITVVPYWEYTVNGEDLVTDVTLYTIAEEGYVAGMDFAVVATENEEPITATVAVTSGSEFVEYNATEQKLTSKGYVGKATVSLSVELYGQTLVKEISVTVLPTIYQHTATVNSFSAIHGDVADDGQGTYGASLREIVGEDLAFAYAIDSQGAVTDLTVKDNKVLGVFDGLTRNAETNTYERTIVVCSQTKGVQMTVTGYSGIFAKAPDFTVFNVNTDVKFKTDSGNVTVAIDEELGIQRWENGYFVLANNIDASNYVHKDNGKNLNQRGIRSFTFPCGMFNSTFDGQGYTIKGMTLGQHGLFGFVKESVIKNVAFVDTKLADVDYATTIAQYVLDSTISNVYVSIANEQVNGKGALFVGGLSGVTMQAVVVETSASLVDKATGLDGALLYQCPDITTDGTAPSYSEVYVLSNAELGRYSSSKFIFYAENESEPTEKEEGYTYYAVAGVKQYAPGAEMTDATFGTYSENYWTITNGAPVWNSASAYFPPEVEVEEEEEGGDEGEQGGTQGSSNQIVGDFNPDWLN